MRNTTRLMAIPGLSRTRQLENMRKESMEKAQRNLSRQAQRRLMTSVIGQIQVSKTKVK
ncbi:hypothetical protein [Bifidobacterium tsurumiense]|uniref:hypothetical protein n=1 Tax=Bifidobacterium tsurumiense TaxID=356829 RepID=UPI0013BE8CB3|nr:hypothetical protein [Bifidobacterium tsurumiense]